MICLCIGVYQLSGLPAVVWRSTPHSVLAKTNCINISSDYIDTTCIAHLHFHPFLQTENLVVLTQRQPTQEYSLQLLKQFQKHLVRPGASDVSGEKRRELGGGGEPAEGNHRCKLSGIVGECRGLEHARARGERVKLACNYQPTGHWIGAGTYSGIARNGTPVH